MHARTAAALTAPALSETISAKSKSLSAFNEFYCSLYRFQLLQDFRVEVEELEII